MKIVPRQVEKQPLTIIIEYPEYNEFVARVVKKINSIDMDFSASIEDRQVRIPLSEIYYFEVFTDQIPNLKKVKLTEKEKEYNFTTKYIPLENIEDEIINNNNLYGDKRRIGKEILEIIKIYKNK